MAETLEGLYAELLATLADPAGGERLLALHAPDAWLVHDGRPARASEIPAEAFAAAHRAAVAAPGRAADVWRPVAASRVAADADGPDAAIAWFPAAPGVLDGKLLALGARRLGDGWRVVWTGVVDAPDGPVWGEGLAGMLGDFPFLPRVAPAPRAWLDVATWRLCDMPRPPILVADDAQFACQASSRCCRIAWNIDVPVIAQAIVDAIPWGDEDADLRGRVLPPAEDGKLRLKARGEPCPYLGPDRYCRIHKRLGTPVFVPCVAFPYRFVETPDGVVASVSQACPSVRDRLGPPLASQLPDIWARLARGGVSAKPRGFRLAPGREVAWPAFQAAEQALRAPLARAELPLARRLWLASRALEARLAGMPDDEAAWLAEPLASASPAAEAHAREQLGLVLYLFSRIDPGLSPLAALEPATGEPDEARVAAFLDGLHFGKHFSYPFDLATAQGVAVLLMHMVRRLTGPDGVPWDMLGLYAYHGAFNTGVEVVAEAFPELAAQLADPAFQRELLALA